MSMPHAEGCEFLFALLARCEHATPLKKWWVRRPLRGLDAIPTHLMNDVARHPAGSLACASC